MADDTTNNAGAGESSAKPATQPVSAADSFETAIGAKLDEAFAKLDGKVSPEPAVPEPASVKEDAPPSSGDDDSEPEASDEGALPKADIAPPTDKVAPPDPDSDEAVDREIDKTTKGWEARQREAFKEKTYKLRELKRQNKALEAKIAEATAAATAVDPKALEAANAKLAELQSKISDYESKIAQVDIQQTSAWQEQVAKPLGEIDALVTKLATKYNADPAALSAAISATGDDRSDKIAAASAEMNDFDRNMFFQAALRREYVSAQAVSMRENASGALQQMTAAQQAAQQQAEAQARAEWETALPKAWDRVVKLSNVLTESDGADDWNAAIAKAKSFASTVKYSDLGAVEQAEVLHRAAAFPLVNSMVRALENEVTALRESLSKYKGAKPAAGGGTPAAPRASVVPENSDWEAAINAKFKEAGLD